MPERSPSRSLSRRILGLGGALVGAIIAIVVVAAVVDLWFTVRDIRAAERIAHDTDLAALDQPGTLTERADRAADRLESAAARTQHSWGLGFAEHVPVVGAEVRALQRLTQRSALVGRTASDTAAAVEQLLGDDGGTRPVAPQRRATLLRRAAAEMATLEERLDQLDLTAVHARLPLLRSADDDLRDRVATAIASADEAAAGMRALAEIVEGPADVLVLGANNAEMRAGAGMVLTAGTARTSDGRLLVQRFQPTQELLLDGGVPVPQEMAELYGWLEPGREWRNTGVSPHFPITAPIYAAMAEQSGLGSPDTVVQVDVVALRHLLEVVGPVRVNGRLVRAAEVERLVLRDLYLEHEGNRDRRRDGLADLAEATFRALDDRSWSPHQLVAALARAAEGRHLMTWSRDPDVQALFARAGIDGALDPAGLLVSVQNHGANKLDWYVRPEIHVDADDGGDRRRVVVDVEIPNEAPAGLPGYVAGGSEPGLAPGDYRALLTLHLPAGATDLTMDPWIEPRLVGREAGAKVVGFRIDIPRGEVWRGSIRFSLPPGPPLVVMPDGRAGDEPHQGAAVSRTT